MFIIDFLTALAMAAVFTIGFCGMAGPRNFQWREASLSSLLLIFFSWMAAVGIIALLPLLFPSRAAATDCVIGLAVFAALGLFASRRVRRAIGVVFQPTRIATRFSVFLYFSIIVSLLFSAVVTRYALARLF